MRITLVRNNQVSRSVLSGGRKRPFSSFRFSALSTMMNFLYGVKKKTCLNIKEMIISDGLTLKNIHSRL